MATIFGKTFQELAQFLGETASKVALKTETGGLTAISTGQAVGGAGLAALTGTVVSYLEYRNQKIELKDAYKKEIATKLGKAEKDITVTDLEFMGDRNRTIRGQLVKARKERNLGIGVITVATLAAVVTALLITSGLGVPAAGGFIHWLATTAVATLAYMAIKAPIKKVAEKLFGVDRKTTHERIEEIHKDHEAGKVISNERVFAVFAHANPEVDQFIKGRYGKEFDKLKVADKMTIASVLGTRLNITQITDDINQGRVQASELAFTVDGDYSGVLPTLGDEPKPGVIGVVKEKIHDAAETLTGHPADEKPRISFADRELARRAAAAELQQQR